MEDGRHRKNARTRERETYMCAGDAGERGWEGRGALMIAAGGVEVTAKTHTHTRARVGTRTNTREREEEADTHAYRRTGEGERDKEGEGV